MLACIAPLDLNHTKMDVKPYIELLKNKITKEHYDFNRGLEQRFTDHLNEYLTDESVSDLEKAFFLILNQFPSGDKFYIVMPNEMVLVPDVYDKSVPGIEYEIDFALYGGSIENPVKVAIECDGLRSHGQKHKKRDRRKDVNLQIAGWVVIRFNSKEIQFELEKIGNETNYVSDFLVSIENTIKEKLRLVDHSSYTNLDYRRILTGYKWDWVVCTNCGNKQQSPINHKKLTCYKCKKKFLWAYSNDKRVKFEQNGLLFFDD